MRKALLAALLGALCLAAAASAQLLPNAGFEAGVLDPWFQTWHNNDYVGYSITSTAPRRGAYCAQGIAGPLGYQAPVALRQEGLVVKPNTTYSVMAWYKTQGAGWGAGNVCDFSVYETDSGGAEVKHNHVDTLTAPKASWTATAVKTFKTGPSTGGANVAFNTYMQNEGNDRIFFDDVVFIEEGLPPNGGFELGTLSPWYNGAPGYVFYFVTDERAQSGEFSVEGRCITTGAPAGVIQWSFPGLKGNTVYWISYWAMTQGAHWGSGNAAECTFYEEKEDGNPWIGHGVGGFTSPLNQWTQFTTTFTSQPETVKGYIHLNTYFTGGAENEKVFADSFQIIELGPPGSFFNPGFELGNTAGWSKTGTGYTFEVTTQDPYSGDYCAVLTGTTWSLSHVFQEVPIQPNKHYDARFAFKKSGVWAPGSNAVDCHIMQFDAGGAFLSNHSLGVPADGTCEWSMHSVQFDSHPNAAKIIWYTSCNLTNGDRMFLDDFSLTVLDPPAPYNTGFELGSLAGWRTYGSGARYSVTTQNPHSGNYAAHVTGNISDENLQGALSALDQDWPVDPDKTYVATMWYRAEGPWVNDAWDSKIIVKDANGVGLEMHSLSIPAAPTAGWVQARVAFRTPSDAAFVTWNNQFNMHSTDHMYLDDFQLGEAVYTAFGSIGAMREAEMGTPATFVGVVTRAIDDTVYFVESPDRSSAIMVESPDFPLYYVPSPGDVLKFRGWTALSTNTYEFNGMQVFRPDATPTAGTPSHVTPLAPLGSILRPIVTGTGAPMDGLLVKVGGMVFNSDPSGTFEINDGSVAGNLRVGYQYGVPFPDDGELVAVTGCVVSHNGVRWLYFTTPDDTVQIIEP